MIPVAKYLNQSDVKIHYSTRLVVGDVSQALADKTKVTVSNQATLKWNAYYYGNGPEPVDYYINFNLNKEVQTSYVFGSKKAEGTYNESTRQQNWSIEVNKYGGTIKNVIVEDTMDPEKQALVLKQEDGRRYLSYDMVDRMDSSKNRSGRLYEKDADSEASGQYFTLTKIDGKEVLKIVFGDLASTEYYKLYLTTSLSDPSLLGGNTDQMPDSIAKVISNKATISGIDGGRETTQTIEASNPVTNTIITKDSVGDYDYSSHEFTWKTMINPDHLAIKDAVITDTLPQGNLMGEMSKVTAYDEKNQVAFHTTTFTDVSAAAGKEAGTILQAVLGEEEVLLDTQANTLSIKGSDGSSITTSRKYEIEYKTRVSDEYISSYLMNNSSADDLAASRTFKNVVKLEGKLTDYSDAAIGAYAYDDAVNKIEKPLLDKSGYYNCSTQDVTWTMVVNPMQGSISQSLLTDDLMNTKSADMEYPLLEYVSDSAVVERVGVNADGSYSAIENGMDASASQPVKDLQSAINHSIDENDNLKFVAQFPSGIVNGVNYGTSTYRITVKTYITDDTSIGSLKNQASLKLNGGAQIDTGMEGCTNSGTFKMGDFISATTNPVVLLKKISANSKDSGENAVVLKDAQYQLTKMNESDGTWTAAATSKTRKTGLQGTLLYLNLKKDTVYKIQETSAPKGYKLDHSAHYIYFKSSADAGLTETQQNALITEGSNDTLTYVEAGTGGYNMIVEDMPDDEEGNTSIVEFLKKGSCGTEQLAEKLAGCTFQLKDNDGKFRVKEAVSDTDGLVRFDHVDPGTYKLSETEAPSQYSLCSDLNVVVTLTEDGHYAYQIQDPSSTGVLTKEEATGQYTVTNQTVRGDITLTKTDIGDSTLGVKGAEFGLFTQEDCSEATKLATAVTGDDGNYTFADVLYDPLCTELYVKEIKAPAGYQLNESVLKIEQGFLNSQVVITDNNSFTLDLTSKSDMVTRENRKLYTLELNKYADTQSDETRYNGVQFQISYQDEDAYTPFKDMSGVQNAAIVNGAEVQVATDGKSVTVKTDTLTQGDITKDGQILIENLPYGNYKITEILTEEQGEYTRHQDINITREKLVASEAEASSKVTQNVVNTSAIMNLKLVKKDATTKETMSGVTFHLTNESDGSVTASTLSTDEQGIVTFTDLSAGSLTKPYTYRLTEDTPAGYQDVSTHSYRIRLYVDKENQTHVQITPYIGTEIQTEQVTESIVPAGVRTGENGTYTYEILNKPIEVETGNTVSLTKKDDSGRPLKNAEFELRRVVDGLESTTIPVLKASTDEEGKLTFYGVEFGNYHLVETKAPEGYETVDTVTITKEELKTGLSEDGTRFSYEIATPVVDPLIRNNVTLYKTVTGDSTKKVSGAEFTIYNRKDQPVAYLLDQHTSGKYELSTSNQDHTVDLSDRTDADLSSSYLVEKDGQLQLIYGKYYVKETVTPKGYEEPEEQEKYTFEIKDGYQSTQPDGIIIVNDSVHHTFTNTRLLGTLEITKTVDTVEKVAGAGITIENNGTSGEGFRFKVTGMNLWGDSIDQQKNLSSDAALVVDHENRCIYVTTPQNGMITIHGLEPSESGYTVEEVMDASNQQYVSQVTANTSPISEDVQNIVKMPVNADNGMDTQSISYHNSIKTGTINGRKINNAETPNGLSGAVIGLFPEDATQYTIENAYETVVSSQGLLGLAKGTFSFAHVPYGRYQIHEITAPDGYLLCDQSIYVTIKEDGEQVNTGKLSLSPVAELSDNILVDELGIGSFSLSKTDAYNGQPMQNMTFTLTGIDKNGVDHSGEKAYTSRSLTDGTVRFDSIPAGSYELKEDKVLGYQQLPTMYVKIRVDHNRTIAELSSDAAHTKAIDKNDEGRYLVANQPMTTGKIRLHKEDQNGNALKGVTFQLYQEGKTIGVDAPDHEVVTDAYGNAVFENVSYGDQTVVEAMGSSHYTSASNISITKQQILDQCALNEDSESFTYELGTITNQIGYGKIELKKADAESSQLLSNAVFTVYDTENGAAVAYLSDVDQDGLYQLTKENTDEEADPLTDYNDYGSPYLIDTEESLTLACGNYKVVETTAPEGYLKAEPLLCSLTEDRQYKLLTNNEDHTLVLDQKAKAALRIHKYVEQIGDTQINHVAGGAGFMFHVTGTSVFGDVVDQMLTTDENSYAEIDSLEAGSYRVEEVRTEQVDSYTLAEPKIITLQVDPETNTMQDLELNIVNKKIAHDIHGVVVTNDNKPLSNIVEGIFTKQTTEYDEAHLFSHMSTVTGNDGSFSFDDIPLGDYKVVQMTEANKYKMDTKQMSVTVGEDHIVIDGKEVSPDQDKVVLVNQPVTDSSDDSNKTPDQPNKPAQPPKPGAQTPTGNVPMINPHPDGQPGGNDPVGVKTVPSSPEIPKPEQENNTPQKKVEGQVDTGDHKNPMIWRCALTISGVMILILGLMFRKRK